MKKLLLALASLFLPFFGYAQAPKTIENVETPINAENIEIVRDEWGVPHIFAGTDAEAVYGLAWAQCEDNFNIMQENFAVLQGQGGILKGKDGVIRDFVAEMFEVDEFVESRYEKDITPEVEQLLSAYAQAINKYAQEHPEELLIEGTFEIDERDILALYTFNFLFMTYAVLDVAKVVQNKLNLYSPSEYISAGSNAMAYSPNITEDKKTYLVANPHLPIEGPINFWEVSVHSEEGLDFFGVTMSGGGVLPVIGTNRHLGWTHTTNSEDYVDVYQLIMHPKKSNHYQFDGEWIPLEEKVVKLKAKIGPVTIPIKRKYYKSKYGPALKNKSGYYALRSNCFFNIRHVEQWYKMVKSENYEEFWDALEIQGLPSQTITYADADNNILHLNNEMMPVRPKGYDWRGIIPGNTSETLWSWDKMVAVKDLVYVENPKSGYVYNCNNTPMDCTGEADNPKLKDYPEHFGIFTTNTARAKRFKELISQHKKVSFEDIRKIREDHSYHSSDLNFRQGMNLNDIFEVVKKHSDLADVAEVLNKWDRNMDVDNKQASLVALFTMFVEDEMFEKLTIYENHIEEETMVEGMRFAKKFLMKNYGTLEVPLGDIQKLVRGDKELPMFGSSQTLANCHVTQHGKGTLKIRHGDTFIMYACYGKNGLESLQNLNLCGNSRKPDSPHFTDQMEMYVKQEVKTVELDLEKLREKAKKTYRPK